MVPEQALGTDQGQKFIYVVNDKKQDREAHRGVRQARHRGSARSPRGLGGSERVGVSGSSASRDRDRISPKEPPSPPTKRKEKSRTDPEPTKRSGQLPAEESARSGTNDDVPEALPAQRGSWPRVSVAPAMTLDGLRECLLVPRTDQVNQSTRASAPQPNRPQLPHPPGRPIGLDLALLHRPPDLRLGPLDRRSRWRAASRCSPAARALSADLAAGRSGRLHLPGPAPRSSPRPSPRRSSSRSTASRTCCTCRRSAPTTARIT